MSNGTLAAVVVAHPDAEIDRRGQRRQLLPAELGMQRGVRVDAAEELGGRDVVIDEDLPRGQLHELIEDLIAHRVVEDERVVRLDRAEEPAIREHPAIQIAARFDGVHPRVVPGPAGELVQGDDVIADRVRRDERRVEVVDRRHYGMDVVGARPMTA
jgi:hypothetical protein